MVFQALAQMLSGRRNGSLFRYFSSFSTVWEGCFLHFRMVFLVSCLEKKKLIQTIQVLQTEKKRHLSYLFPTSSESLPDPGMSLTLLLGKRERLIACHDWGWNKCRMRAVFLPEKIHQRKQKNPSWSRCVLCRAVICKIIIELMALKGWTRPKSSCSCFCNLMLTTSLILWNLADWCHANTKFFRGALSSGRMSFVTWYSSWPVSPLLFFQCSHKAP